MPIKAVHNIYRICNEPSSYEMSNHYVITLMTMYMIEFHFYNCIFPHKSSMRPILTLHPVTVMALLCPSSGWADDWC